MPVRQIRCCFTQRLTMWLPHQYGLAYFEAYLFIPEADNFQPFPFFTTPLCVWACVPITTKSWPFAQWMSSTPRCSQAPLMLFNINTACGSTRFIYFRYVREYMYVKSNETHNKSKSWPRRLGHQTLSPTYTSDLRAGFFLDYSLCYVMLRSSLGLLRNSVT